MPRYISILTGSQIGACGGTANPGDPSICGFTLLEKYFDEDGDGILYWTQMDGVLPTDVEVYLDVYQNGKRLEHGSEYSVTPDSGPAQSTITIEYPVPAVYYVVKVEYPCDT